MLKLLVTTTKYVMPKNTIYKAEDIFEDIEGDDKNVLMNIPPEILEQMGWAEGDVLKITVDDGVMSIKKTQTDIPA